VYRYTKVNDRRIPPLEADRCERREIGGREEGMASKLTAEYICLNFHTFVSDDAVFLFVEHPSGNYCDRC